jgi:pilus assembly protein CpaD
MFAFARKDKIAMLRTTPIPILIALSASLCASNAAAQRAVSNRTLYSTNQPVVERTDYVINLSTDGNGLSRQEQSRLDAWFGSLRVGYGDKVYVEGDAYSSGGRAHVAQVAADYGLLLNEGAPVTEGTLQPGQLRVIVSRSEASVPGCPNWERTSGPGATSANYGCAINSNLAAMIADPGDLVLGQTGSVTGDAAISSKAIRAYRQAPPTGTQGLQETKSKGGK